MNSSHPSPRKIVVMEVNEDALIDTYNSRLVKEKSMRKFSEYRARGTCNKNDPDRIQASYLEQREYYGGHRRELCENGREEISTIQKIPGGQYYRYN